MTSLGNRTEHMKVITLTVESYLDKFIQIAADNGIPIKRPEVRYDLKGKAAGYASRDNWIKLNIDLLNNPEHFMTMVNDVLGHEFAHIMQFQTNKMVINGKRKPHGPWFKHYCRMLGVSDARTHSMKTTPARIKTRYVYYCKCDAGCITSPIIHNKMQRKGYNYLCKNCNTMLYGLSFKVMKL